MTVVILSKNPRNLLPCLAAVRKHEPLCQIIVVDDGLPADFWPHAGVGRIGGIKPFVFARNANLGIMAAGRDDVVLLNDDALLTSPGGFSRLQKSSSDHPEYGVISAACNNVGNRNQWQTSGCGIMGAGVRGGLLDGLRDEPRMVCFVAVYIPRTTIDTVGLLDERFTGYGCDDDDYCVRVRHAGLKIGIHDGCYVDHGSLTSTFRGAAGAGGDFRPNLELFRQKWGADNWHV